MFPVETAPPSAFVKVGDGNAISWLRYRCGENGFRGLLRQLGTLTMNRIEPAGPGTGLRRPLVSDADPESGAAAAERVGTLAVAPPNPAFPVAARPKPKICWTFKQLPKKYGMHPYKAGLDRSFQTLSDNPAIVRLRLEIAPPVRVYPARKHMIVCTIAENGGTVFVLRVRHHRENWKEHPIENMP